MIQIGLQNADSSFLDDVAYLRELIGGQEGDVYIESDTTLSIACIAWASWAEKRCIVFAQGGVDTLMKTRPLVVISDKGIEEARGNKRRVDRLSLFDLEPSADLIIAEFHTSGSSGNPICLRKSARQLFGEARFLVDYFSIKKDMVLMSGVPAHHLFGFLFSVMIPTISGCELVLQRPLHGDSIGQLAMEFDVDFFVSTPFQLRNLSSSLTPDIRVFSSGAPLPESTRTRLEGLGMSIVEIFGSTETGGIASRRTGAAGPEWIPFPPVTIRTDEQGLMEVRSPFVEHSEAYFKTQDRIQISIDGQGFTHLGRADDILKIGGKRISKDALKAHLIQHDKVVDAAIALVDGSRLHALVVVGDDTKSDQVRAHLLVGFEKSILPKIHIVNALPRTALGKISRKDLMKIIQDAKQDVDILERRMDKNSLSVKISIPQECVYFEGHFDGFPILPGVAQLSIIRKEIQACWPDLSAPKALRALKFKSPITPNSRIEIVLDRLDKDVKFTIIFDPQPQDGSRHICTSGAFIHHD